VQYKPVAKLLASYLLPNVAFYKYCVCCHVHLVNWAFDGGIPTSALMPNQAPTLVLMRPTLVLAQFGPCPLRSSPTSVLELFNCELTCWLAFSTSSFRSVLLYALDSRTTV